MDLCRTSGNEVINLKATSPIFILPLMNYTSFQNKSGHDKLESLDAFYQSGLNQPKEVSTDSMYCFSYHTAPVYIIPVASKIS